MNLNKLRIRFFKGLTVPLLLTGLLFQMSCSNDTLNSEVADSQEILNPELPYRPNILWLVAEDLSPYIPAYGDSTVTTPVLDRLAREGVVYDNFFSPHPVCAPARASIITGMYANHIAASHMRTGPWFAEQIPPQVLETFRQYMPEGVPPYEAMPPADVHMFTEYLRMAGYFCTNNAKQDYQFRGSPVAWDENGRQAGWSGRKSGQPFFAIFNFEVTHESQIWAKADDSLWVDPDLEVPVPPYLPDTEIGRNDVRRMYSNIKEMDHQVGEILKRLEQDGLLDSTIVIWYTDHGGMLPRQKRALYESGIHVPMIIRFPNQEFAGQRDSRMISFIDLAPTVLSLAKIKPPENIDGSAFLGKYVRAEEPEYVFGAADRFDEKTDRIRFARNDRYKYIRNYMTEQPVYMDLAYRKQMPIMQELLRLKDAGELTPEQALWFRDTKAPEELYDLVNDPHELNNLAGDESYEAVLKELSDAMDTWLASIEDTGLMDEKKLIEQLWPEGTQPTTANPAIRVDSAGKVVISTETPGASIGYKIIGQDSVVPESWEIYDQPVVVESGQMILAVAHRLGYIRSEEINFKVE